MRDKAHEPRWRIVKFGDIAQNVAVRVDPADAKTDVYVGLEHLDPSTLHLRQWGHPSDVTGQKLTFKKGDVIFGRRRAYQRKLAVAEFDGICSAHAMVVRAKPKMILPEFLPFFLQSDMFMERAIEISVGSLSPTINWKTLRVQEFPLPPLDEQQRVAKILWAADEAISSYEKSVENLHEVKQRRLTELLTLGNSEHVLKLIYSRKSNAIMGKNGSRVELKTAEEFCNSVADGTHASPKPSETGYPLVTSKNLTKGYLELSECYLISEEDYKEVIKRSWVEPHDILFAMIGTIGNPVIVPKEQENIATKNVGIFRFNGNSLKSKWFYIFLNSSIAKNQIERELSGSTQKYFALAKLRSLLLPVPENLVDMENAVNEYDQMIAVEEMLKTQVFSLRNMAKSFQEEVFWEKGDGRNV